MLVYVHRLISQQRVDIKTPSHRTPVTTTPEGKYKINETHTHTHTQRSSHIYMAHPIRSGIRSRCLCGFPPAPAPRLLLSFILFLTIETSRSLQLDTRGTLDCEMVPPLIVVFFDVSPTPTVHPIPTILPNKYAKSRLS